MMRAFLLTLAFVLVGCSALPPEARRALIGAGVAIGVGVAESIADEFREKKAPIGTALAWLRPRRARWSRFFPFLGGLACRS